MARIGIRTLENSPGTNRMDRGAPGGVGDQAAALLSARTEFATNIKALETADDIECPKPAGVTAFPGSPARDAARPCQNSLRHEEVVLLQVAFLSNILAEIETPGLLIAGVRAESEFQPLLFRHVDESLVRRMRKVVYFDCEILPFQGCDYLLHSFVGPQRIVVARNADRQEERPSEDVQRFIVVDDFQDMNQGRIGWCSRAASITGEVGDGHCRVPKRELVVGLHVMFEQGVLQFREGLRRRQPW